jgi:DnaJ like chaperone protein
MQYHPDKVRHLGEEFRKVAEEKMKDINAAYDYLSKS